MFMFYDIEKRTYLLDEYDKPIQFKSPEIAIEYYINFVKNDKIALILKSNEELTRLIRNN